MEDEKKIEEAGLPEGVLELVRGGEELRTAKVIYENAELRKRISELEKAEENAARSTGSRRSAGGESNWDAFDAAWEEN